MKRVLLLENKVFQSWFNQIMTWIQMSYVLIWYSKLKIFFRWMTSTIDLGILAINAWQFLNLFEGFLDWDSCNKIFKIICIFTATLQKKLESTQEELMRTQIRYQKEIEKLENQNRELRKQLMLRGNMTLKQQRKIKKSLIDMYSEVLDQLSGMNHFKLQIEIWH